MSYPKFLPSFDPSKGALHLILDNHRLFPHVLSLTTCMAAISIAADYVIAGHVNYANDASTSLSSARFPTIAVRLPLKGPVEGAVHNQKPRGMHVGFAQNTPIGGPQSSGFMGPVQSIFISTFVCFYEDYREWLEEYVKRTFTKQPKHPFEAFPAVWQFGRLIRNGASHGGSKINFSNPKLPPVSWYGLTYSHADDGRVFLGNDVSLADIIILMVEMSAELDALGCPF